MEIKSVTKNCSKCGQSSKSLTPLFTNPIESLKCPKCSGAPEIPQYFTHLADGRERFVHKLTEAENAARTVITRKSVMVVDS